MAKGSMVLEGEEVFSITPLNIPGESLVRLWVEASLHSSEASTLESAWEEIQTGLGLAQELNHHLFCQSFLDLGIQVALKAGELERAFPLLEQWSTLLSSNHLFWQCQFHYDLACALFLSGENPLGAQASAEKALALAVAAGSLHQEALCRLTLSQGLHETGQRRQALNELAAAQQLSHRIGNPGLEFRVLITRADQVLADDDREAGRQALRAAFDQRLSGSTTSLLWWLRPAQIARLCAWALEFDIAQGFARALIHRRNLLSSPPSLEMEKWPWPVRIFTLERFEILRDGVPLRFSGKVQQKPLLLLKLLIALGGKGVREDQVTDLLWPEADGDAAHSAFTSTLSRLRHTLGVEGLIRCQDRRLTLNSQLCWVDAWAFERSFNRCETLTKEDIPHPRQAQSLIALADRALRLYQGTFLAGESLLPCILSRRERLRSKFLRLTLLAGQVLEQLGRWEEAAGYYLRGLEIDDLVEDFYRQLMICNQQLGRRVEALAVFRRCRQTLELTLGIKPSRQIRALGQAIGDEE